MNLQQSARCVRCGRDLSLEEIRGGERLCTDHLPAVSRDLRAEDAVRYVWFLAFAVAAFSVFISGLLREEQHIPRLIGRLFAPEFEERVVSVRAFSCSDPPGFMGQGDDYYKTEVKAYRFSSSNPDWERALNGTTLIAAAAILILCAGVIGGGVAGMLWSPTVATIQESGLSRPWPTVVSAILFLSVPLVFSITAVEFSPPIGCG